ncbi:MAG: chromosomal replication initiator protein DnaA [Bacteroidaceae bacterium]|nr:chromosomal replication initiator protein DnaA [Bacteroidaceae bacterium]MBO5079266.1 chromosomal replication initiator protein DnaA [Bacteroidaceae bacterium]MBQ4589354.1 chromosomal replication initiator protein DnaA [Bacteroidaceae bacterium]
MIENDYVGLWNRCLQMIHDNVPETTFKTWFEPIVPLKYEEKALTIGVPSPFFYEFLEEKFADLLRATLNKQIGEGTRLMYSVLTDKTNRISVNIEGTNRSSAIPVPGTIREGNKTPNPMQAPAPQDLDPHLNPNYNFDTFIKGASNEFSRTVGETVAKNPAKTFNPLFLYGPSGCGKTHLTNAIGTRIKELYPEKRVLYVSAHLLQVQYTDSVRTNNYNSFMKFYQNIDVLIVDDIQEFAGLSKTQNTFFHIFNHLHQNGKQLILTSDRAPVMLQGMEERMLTRFKWGLVAELEKPDMELRKNILRNKIHRDGLNIPDNVINYIAENVNESVRELEGIINSLLAQSILFKREIDMSLAERIIKKAVRIIENKPITIEEIIAKVCEHYKMDESVLHTKSRKREIVQVRQVAMFLAKKHTDISTSKIGHLIGNRDHATVLHACKIMKDLVEVDKEIRADIEEIETSFKQR